MRLIILTGSMGAGKSTVLAEASDILSQRRIPHAAIDFDALGLSLLPDNAKNDDLMHENLRNVVANYTAHGVEHFLIARALESTEEAERCSAIVRPNETVICLLKASRRVMTERVSFRETGTCRDRYIARVALLDEIIDRARVEQFVVVNECRPLTDVALEVLLNAGWITD